MTQSEIKEIVENLIDTFLYAGKVLHLPSVNEIRALITKERFENRNASENGKRNEIFFFGG